MTTDEMRALAQEASQPYGHNSINCMARTNKLAMALQEAVHQIEYQAPDNATNALRTLLVRHKGLECIDDPECLTCEIINDGLK